MFYPLVCCNNVKPQVNTVDVDECPASEGKQCVSLDKCNNEAILTNAVETSSLLDIRSDGHVDLNADANLCSVDNKVCCTPKDDIDLCSNKKKKQYVHKCGRHNSQGEGLRISNPFSGKDATQFGEWPHACIVYKKTPQGRDVGEFLGGASLIAPGIVTTVAHKVE